MIKNALLAIALVFVPIKGALLTVLILILFDLITGVLAAKKRNEPISSKNLRRTVTKLFVYEITMLVTFLAETYLIGDIFPLVKIVGAFIGLAELKSVIENLNDIGGGNLLASILDKLNHQELDK